MLDTEFCRIGSPDSLSFEINLGSNTHLRPIRVFVAGQEITVVDRNAHVPQFKESLHSELGRLEAFDPDRFAEYFDGEELRGRFQFLVDLRKEDSNPEYLNADLIFDYYRFLDWGPTTDDVTAFLIPSTQGPVHLVFEVCAHDRVSSERTILSAPVKTEELATTIRLVVAEL